MENGFVYYYSFGKLFFFLNVVVEKRIFYLTIILLLCLRLVYLRFLIYYYNYFHFDNISTTHAHLHIYLLYYAPKTVKRIWLLTGCPVAG